MTASDRTLWEKKTEINRRAFLRTVSGIELADWFGMIGSGVAVTNPEFEFLHTRCISRNILNLWNQSHKLHNRGYRHAFVLFLSYLLIEN